jgi:chromosome segregation protein
MRLKRLTCRGFKSFADHTEFEFDASLTGIVGPNGCGKSNVVDAVKWVLGDQRARSLRGEEMTDVIFKGAETRDPLPYAWVEIQLEDERGLLDGRTEVTIGRKLTRDKESEYLINGEPVRLKDVRTAMLDTGLGVGAYSVMEQGRIDAVLSANPEDRRAIFEEAAGISRFKAQKRESLRKLERTEQNLARVVDLLEERAKRIRSLKIQATRARRYTELRDQLRDYKAALAVVEAQRIRAEQKARGEALAEHEAAQRAAEAQLAELRAELDAIEERIRAETESIDAEQEQIRQLRRACDAARSKVSAASERSAEHLADAEQAAARRAGAAEQQRERAAQLEEAQARLAGLEAELAALEAQVAERAAHVAAQQRELDELAAARESARKRMLEWIHRKTRAHNRCHEAEAQLRTVRAREQRLDERLRAVTAELEALTEQRAAQDHAREQAKLQAAVLRDDEKRVRADLEAAEGEAAELGRREAALREQLSAVAGQVQLLADVERQMEGLDRGPRWLLQHRPPGLRGRLLDLIDVDLDYGPALEAALGPLVQALVVDTRANADAMLRALDAGRHGRAALLVEEEFSRAPAEGEAPALPEGARWLADAVRVASPAEPLLRWLLRGVCVVESEAAALPERLDLCFVTRSGALLHGPRLEGGHGEAHGGLVVRKVQMQHLREREAALRANLAELQQGRQGAVGKVDALMEQVRRLAERLQSLHTEEQTLANELRRLDDRCAHLRREREVHELELTEVRQHGLAARAVLNTELVNSFLLQRLERREAEAEEAASRAWREAQARAGAAREAEHEVRLRLVACAADRDALRGTIEAHRRGLVELERAAAELVEREEAARAAAARLVAEAAAAETEAARLDEQIAGGEAARATRVAALGESRAARDRQRAAVAELEEQRAQRVDRVTALRLELSDLDHRFARVDDRLREDCWIELRRCLGEISGLGLVEREPFGPPLPPEMEGQVDALFGPELPPEVVRAEAALNRLWEDPGFKEDETKRHALVLQSQVDRLGHVNLDAVRELEESETSYTFLQQEVDDLKESRRALMETLRRLELESKTLFEATFEEARKNFQSIFRKLFQGGKADMHLTAGEDSLEAGIEIIAKPPGKELQSINLLSGGERSLTALAILFAVFKVKPSPFCILDEVDAALDDTNVERFLRVLRDFVGPTQFCVVTHHKRTMAECQKLYGITMQQRGVSSRIAVSLDEVEHVTGGTDGTGPGRLVDARGVRAARERETREIDAVVPEAN